MKSRYHGILDSSSTPQTQACGFHHPHLMSSSLSAAPGPQGLSALPSATISPHQHILPLASHHKSSPPAPSMGPHCPQKKGPACLGSWTLPDLSPLSLSRLPFPSAQPMGLYLTVAQPRLGRARGWGKRIPPAPGVDPGSTFLPKTHPS